jgi:SAM-dependent methyltransferase
MLMRIVNRALAPFGVKVIPKRLDDLFYQHDYGAGGFEAYQRTQIHWNKAKLHKVWADAQTLEVVANDIERRDLKSGLCHGARNGFEVAWLGKRLRAKVIGTDISETAADFPGMVVQDFHEPRDEWVGAWDFIYTNSLDQAFDPRKALDTWADQLAPNGCIYIEHTMAHSAAGASHIDPFGAHPMAMPYLIFQWGRGKYGLADILEPSDVAGKGKVWVFVIEHY